MTNQDINLQQMVELILCLFNLSITPIIQGN